MWILWIPGKVLRKVSELFDQLLRMREVANSRNPPAFLDPGTEGQATSPGEQMFREKVEIGEDFWVQAKVNVRLGLDHPDKPPLCFRPA